MDKRFWLLAPWNMPDLAPIDLNKELGPCNDCGTLNWQLRCDDRDCYGDGWLVAKCIYDDGEFECGNFVKKYLGESCW